MDAAALDEIIRGRRTIKPFKMSDQEVSEADLGALLENANWAPSHGLTEPWRFKIFRGNARERLAQGLSDLYERVIPQASQRAGKSEKLRKMPLRAPVTIVVWMKRQSPAKIAEIEEVAAVACAVQNMHLTAAARGLAAFWSTPPFLYSPEMNEWLGIETKDQCLGIFYVGHPENEEAKPTSRRTPIDEKVEWIDT